MNKKSITLMSSIKNYRITVLHMQQLTVSRLKKRFENSAVIIYEIVQMDNLNCSVLIKNQAMDFLMYTLFILLFSPPPPLLLNHRNSPVFRSFKDILFIHC